VNAFAKQGVTSSFRFGMGYGSILGVLSALNVQIVDVAPGLWKKHFRLDSDKEKARALAIKRFPNAQLNRKKDAGRAEALLMALWLRETHA
jgi:crossover junction endodeoxyribonuclease RuvC